MCSHSYVHVYRIEYVSYRQGPYRIRIVSAADRIVPALVYMVIISNMYHICKVHIEYVSYRLQTVSSQPYYISRKPQNCILKFMYSKIHQQY